MLEQEITAVETRLLRYFKPQTGTLYDDLIKTNSRQDVWRAMLHILHTTKVYIYEPFVDALKQAYAANSAAYSDSADEIQALLSKGDARSYAELFLFLASHYDFNLGVDTMSNPGLESIEQAVLPNLDNTVKAMYAELKGTGNWSDTELGAFLISVKNSNEKDIEEVMQSMKDIITSLDSAEDKKVAFQEAMDAITEEDKTTDMTDEDVIAVQNKVHNQTAVGIISDEESVTPADEPVEPAAEEPAPAEEVAESATEESTEKATEPAAEEAASTEETSEPVAEEPVPVEEPAAEHALDTSVSNFEESGGVSTDEIADEVTNEEAVLADEEEIEEASTEYDNGIALVLDEGEETEPYEEDNQSAEFPDSDDAAIENGTLVEEDGTEYPDSDDAAVENGTLVEEDGTEYPDSDDAAVENGTLINEDGEEYPDELESAVEKETDDIAAGRLVIEDDENDSEVDTPVNEDDEPVDESGEEFPDDVDSTIEKETDDIEKGTLVIEDDENDAEEVFNEELSLDDNVEVIKDAEDEDSAELDDTNDIRSVLKMPKVDTKSTSVPPMDDDDPYDELSFEHENAVPAGVTAPTVGIDADNSVQISINTKLRLGETINISITRSIDGVSLS